MNIVGLDTSMAACSVAAGTGTGTSAPRIVRRWEAMSTGHAERLMPMLDEVLREAGLRLADVDRLVTTIGPGTFTGTRISVSAARALALALHIPIVAVTSLEVMAHAPSIQTLPPGTRLLIASDANRGEAYVQMFDGATRAPLSAPRIAAITTEPWGESKGPTFVAGSAAEAIVAADAAARFGTSVLQLGAARLLPDIASILPFAAAAVPSHTPPAPLYLRPPDAKPQDGKSLPRATP